jgi:hypothetical protein
MPAPQGSAFCLWLFTILLTLRVLRQIVVAWGAPRGRRPW